MHIGRQSSLGQMWRLAALVVLNAAAACANDSGSFVIPFAQVTRVVLSRTAVNLYAGDTTRIEATAYDGSSHTVTNARFAWSSSDTSIATIDVDGLIAARRNGAVNVTAQVGTASATASVGVSPIASMGLGDSISFVGFWKLPSEVRLSLHAGDTVDLSVWVSADAIALNAILWDSVAIGGHAPEHAKSFGNASVLGNGFRGTVIPGLVAPTTGEYPFRIDAYVTSGPCGVVLPNCPFTTIVKTRRSLPVVP